MTASRWMVGLLFTVLAPGLVRADMGMPGFKSIELQVVFDNLDDFPDYHFYLAQPGWRPSDTEPEPEPLTSAGIRVNHGKGMYWTVAAVPRRWGDRTAGVPADILYSDRVEVPSRESLPGIWPVDYEVRHFRIELAPGRLVITPGPVERHADGFSSWAPCLASVGALLALGTWLIWRVWLRRLTGTVTERNS